MCINAYFNFKVISHLPWINGRQTHTAELLDVSNTGRFQAINAIYYRYNISRWLSVNCIFNRLITYRYMCKDFITGSAIKHFTRIDISSLHRISLFLSSRIDVRQVTINDTRKNLLQSYPTSNFESRAETCK